MKTLYTFILLLIFSTLFAQQRLHINAPAIFEISSDTNHSSIRFFDADTLQNNLAFSAIKSNKIILAPIFASDATYSIKKTEYSHYASFGLAFQYKPCKKLFINSQLLGINYNLPNYMSTYFDTLPFSVLNSNLLGNNNKNFILNFTFDFRYQLSKTFSLNVGNGKLFLGEGYRSLLISDQSVDAPFFSINTDLKKVKYLFRVNRWQQNIKGDVLPKYSAMHYLSWDIKNRLNISLFETVVWEATDSVRPRGIEWTYMNPVLFIRPAEFSLGSPDNMIMGGALSYRFGKNTKIYAQAALDEFYLSEIKNWAKHLINKSDTSIKYEAWVNKHAFQFGVKSSNIFNIDGLNALAELNYVRPYTYSHVRVGKTYTHNNQPIAHPYGANFSEILLRAEYVTKRFAIILSSSLKKTGYDTIGTHYGQDILQSTFDCPTGQNNIVVTFYGNEVGQGVPVKVAHGIAEFRYKLNRQNPIWIRFGSELRHESIDKIKNNYVSIFAGLLINMRPRPDFMY